MIVLISVLLLIISRLSIQQKKMSEPNAISYIFCTIAPVVGLNSHINPSFMPIKWSMPSMLCIVIFSMSRLADTSFLGCSNLRPLPIGLALISSSHQPLSACEETLSIPLMIILSVISHRLYFHIVWQVRYQEHWKRYLPKIPAVCVAHTSPAHQEFVQQPQD